MTITAPAPRRPTRQRTSSARRVCVYVVGLTRQRMSSARRAALYVVGLLWALPLLAFTLAAVRADATACVATNGVPCNDQGLIVTTGVLTAVLLLPVGLVALLTVPLLTTTARRPIVVAAVASALGLAAGGLVVGAGYLVLNT